MMNNEFVSRISSGRTLILAPVPAFGLQYYKPYSNAVKFARLT
jgi:hypothetical protein